jgi:hypothetical protein
MWACATPGKNINSNQERTKKTMKPTICTCTDLAALSEELFEPDVGHVRHPGLHVPEVLDLKRRGRVGGWVGGWVGLG